ncbi:hypothetical protein EC845_2532 [Comamonas sp. BIGb0124]|uniref:hypothetical protein n=1 Tax=Comamonas sp. BIGb0124 TaxID=2485130 RepID=UPI000FA9600C|nr:hypothetical protein [Comamonas sp. BIGb0124]ROR21710.1 hypothetical protein EC845_2532 [Comamonas sp. BIGb0124]
MHETLSALQQQLNYVLTKIAATVPPSQPFGIAHANWSFPGLTSEELSSEAQSLIDLISENASDDLGDSDAVLSDYIRRLKFLADHTIPNLWGNAAAAVPTYILTLRGLRKAITTAIVRNDYAEAATKLRKMTAQVRSMEARLRELEPRTSSLKSMVSRIEDAHDAADQLPTDLHSLKEAREQLENLITAATKDSGHIEGVRSNADLIDAQLKQSALESQSVLERCETAYSAATSVGLAAAFNERSTELSKSMWIWVAGLVATLIAGSFFGSIQLHALSELFKQPGVTTSAVFLNLLLSLLSVGAPIWFGWLATKQIGQRFRLAEDYAFKASISRAYEGFRREAARIDKDMEAKLLASALSRFDELPLRLVETTTHGSPWHELASSDLVKDAIRMVPGFASQIKDVAARAMETVHSTKKKGGPSISPEE